MESLRWWQRAVFYQIYPRSFADGNGDGIGDFVGMAARLDYLRELGVDALWLSPHYPSPFLDCGYDITDYTGVAPEYGTLDDFAAFLREAHARGLRVILDLVLNHSSDQHPWFVESRAGRDSPKRDWYVWRDPAPGGGPPNNWTSIFGGPAWTLDPATGQYYYHAFLKEQPDLNWRSPALKAAMWDAARFWLDLGVDGFRLDAIATIFEDPELRDHDLDLDMDALVDVNTLTPEQYERLMGRQSKQPGLHELMRELRALVDAYPGDRVLVGEDDDLTFHGSGEDELHLVFNFPLMRARRLTPGHVRANQALRLAALPAGAWPCNTLGNHDSPRVWSRYGDGARDGALARLHLALLLTLKGTPFLYYGEEIGMADLQLGALEQVRDMAALHRYARLVGRGGVAPEAATRITLATTRDRCRGPMQWGAGPNAGFSPPGVATWLPVHPNAQAGVSVAAQAGDPGSLLGFYRRMLALRRATPALVAGDYEDLPEAGQGCLAFLRRGAGQACLVALSFAADAQALDLGPVGGRARLRFASAGRAEGGLVEGELALGPFEVVVAELG